MKTMAAADIQRLVPKALGRYARDVEPLGANRWSCGLPSGAENGLPKARLDVRLDNGWLSVSADVDVGEAASRKSMDLLKLGAVFPGGARIAMERDSQRIFVLRDAWVASDGYQGGCEDTFDDYAHASAESRLEHCLLLALRDIKDALAVLEGRKAAERPQCETGADHPVFAALCREAGWRCTEHRDGRLAVELDGSRCYRQAFVDPGRGGGVRVWTPLLEIGDLSEPSLEAIGVLLLRTNGLLRMARAAAGDAEGRDELVFEVLLSIDRAYSELDRALSALQIAGRFWAREVDALTNEPAARALLRIWGLR